MASDGTLTWLIYILCLGCALVAPQGQPNIDGGFKPPINDDVDFVPPTRADDYFDPFETLLQEMPFHEMVQAFAEVLNQGTIKESLGKVCMHARRIIDTITSQEGGPDNGNPFPDTVHHGGPFPGTYSDPVPVDNGDPFMGMFPGDPSSLNVSFDLGLDTFCAPIERAVANGEDVDLYEKICTLLELSIAVMNDNGDPGFNFEEEHHQHDQHGSYWDGDFIEVPPRYKTLFDSFLLLTFDSFWSKEWRYYITSPRELLDSAFRQDWESGKMDCGLLSVRLGELTGKQFITHSMRRVFFEMLRDEYRYKICGEYSDSLYGGLKAFSNRTFIGTLIDTMQAHLFPINNCTLLRSALYSENSATLKDILDTAVSNYYSIITDNTKCNQFLQSAIGRYPDHEQAITNYTGYSGIGGLCEALRKVYDGNPEDLQQPPFGDMSHYGGYRKRSDGSTPYKSLLSLSALFLDGTPALTALSEICKAFNDLNSEDIKLCAALKEASALNSWGSFSETCEKTILQRMDYNAWRERFYGNQAFSIVFNSFFLFTFNGDWNMPYRHEFVTITKFLRESFDLWQNYDTICQDVGNALNEAGSVLISNAVKTTFRNYIRDHLSVICTPVTAAHHPSPAYPAATAGYPSIRVYPTAANPLDDPEKQAEVVLVPMFEYLVPLKTKLDMCATFPKSIEHIEIASELATASFLELLGDESKCQDFFKIYEDKSQFPEALRRFTGFETVQEFCRYLVTEFNSPSEEIREETFETKYMNDPYDVYLDSGNVFSGVHYKDLITVAVYLRNSPTIRDGLILLCETFKNNLDITRMDSDICEALRSQSRNFQDECQMSKWLTKDYGPDRKRYTFPWIEFERWLPDWFYDYSGFDNVFYMYIDWHLIEPIVLDLSQVLNDILNFPNPDTHGTCNRLADVFHNETIKFGTIVDKVLEHTLDHLSSIAPVLCLSDNIPFPKTAYANFDVFNVAPTPMAWPYNETYWKHVHIGPIEGPLVGKLFAYLAGYDPISSMCPLLRSVESVYPDMLKRKAMENLSKIRTHEGYCKLFIDFIDEERRKAYKNILTLAENTGFKSTQSLCNVLVTAFSNVDTLLQFDWSSVTEHYRLYKPDEWVSQSPGEIFPGATYEEMIKLIGGIYDESLRSGVETICSILNIQSYANDFPFENELCILVRDSKYDFEFRQYCQNESQYNTYYPGFPSVISPHFYPNMSGDHFYEEEMGEDVPQEILVLYDFARGQFGLDVTNPWAICEVAGDLLVSPITDIVDTMKTGISLVIRTFLRYRHDIYCFKESDKVYSDNNSDDFPLEILAEALAVLAEYDTSQEFCNYVEGLLPEHGANKEGQDSEDRCSPNPDKEALDGSLETIATAVVSSALMIIEDTNVCNKIVAILYTYFGEYIVPATGYDTSAELCKMIVAAFSAPPADTIYKPPVIPSNVADLFEDFEPFKEAGQILPFLTIDQAIEFVGFLYNKPTPRAILTYLCENYKDTLDSFDMEELDPLKRGCQIIIDGDIVPFCEEQLIPLMYGEEYPIGLRQINIPFELERIFVSLAGEEMVMSSRVITSAIETVINSQMSIRDVVNEVLDSLLPNVIRSTTDICQNWDTVIEFLKPKWEWTQYDPQSSNPDDPPHIREERQRYERDSQIIEKIFDFVGTLSGYATTEGTFDCNRLVTEDPKTVTEMLKKKLWCYTKDVYQCKLAADAMMTFVNDVSDDEEMLTEEMLSEFTGYPSTLDMCQAVVDAISEGLAGMFISTTERVCAFAYTAYFIRLTAY